ncbi:MAG: type III-A CRISPR-associated protein Csm2 [Paludibacteraceae bacterium]|nr:type III-A CRISPR-associated protein Csm2 [Paludibacteraceae bacterium]
MVWDKNKLIPKTEITEKVTSATVDFAKEFGSYLGVDDSFSKNGKTVSAKNHLTTNQLRKFFGEVKRQQMSGYNETDFVLLKPKLAYAVGRAKEKDAKIKDFYFVIADAIDKVRTERDFKNFIKIFEAIVAYHKAAEEKISL